MQNEELVTLTADIVAAYVSNNSVAVSDMPVLITRVHDSLAALGADAVAGAESEEAVPVVSVRASLKPDHLTCLDCGQKVKMLRRHIRSAHDLDEAGYRAKYKLAPSYPMIAPNYSEMRKNLARQIGLGSQGRGGGRKRREAAAK